MIRDCVSHSLFSFESGLLGFGRICNSDGESERMGKKKRGRRFPFFLFGEQTRSGASLGESKSGWFWRNGGQRVGPGFLFQIVLELFELSNVVVFVVSGK